MRRMFEAFVEIESSHTSDFPFPKRHIFLHPCATCSEQPYNISTTAGNYYFSYIFHMNRSSPFPRLLTIDKKIKERERNKAREGMREKKYLYVEQERKKEKESER